MNAKLPPPIAAYFHAANTKNTDALLALLTVDACVADEGRDYRGAEIKEWFERVSQEYQPRAEVTAIMPVTDKQVVTAQVSGSFPGSPIQLHYNFTLEGDRIAALAIGA